MNLGVPRAQIVTLAAIFSAFHIFLAAYSLPSAPSRVSVVLAMVLYAAATVVSLLPGARMRLPIWVAAFNVSIVIIMSLLVTNELDPRLGADQVYATWHIAAAGTLLTITSTRRRHSYAWAGIVFLVVQTTLWAGPAALVTLGVVGSLSWVAMSNIISKGMDKAMKDAHRFAVAEREATDWQAAQEAHVFERQLRLSHTSTMALPMLQRIAEHVEDLTEEERAECFHLEAGIRDEIRGRRLLDDGVRAAVRGARRRGTTVTLLDEGGIDDLGRLELDRVLAALAAAIAQSTADTVIVRTAASDSSTAVTVVGLRSSGSGGADLEDGAPRDGVDPHDADDEVELWLEIPRAAVPHAAS